MAKSGPSEEELQLRKRARRRLIGAIAVVLLVALFLPMVLDHEPKPVTQNIEIEIPSPDKAGTFNSKIIALPPAAAQSGAAMPAPESAGAPEIPPTAPVAPTPAATSSVPPAPTAAGTAPAPVTAPAAAPETPRMADKPAAKPAPKADKPKAPAVPAAPATKSAPKAQDKPKAVEKEKAAAPARGTSWVVQVAALNDAAKAKQVQEQMTAAGIATYTELLPTAHGSVTRVRAGPYKTREEADKARDRLKGLGLGGNVVPK